MQGFMRARPPITYNPAPSRITVQENTMKKSLIALALVAASASSFAASINTTFPVEGTIVDDSEYVCTPKARRGSIDCHWDGKDNLDFGVLTKSEIEQSKPLVYALNIKTPDGEKYELCPDKPSAKWSLKNGQAVGVSPKNEVSLEMFNDNGDGTYTSLTPQHCKPIVGSGHQIVRIRAQLTISGNYFGPISADVRPVLVKR